VALRPVLVYGPGAKGNMARLLELVRSPYPLPFGALTAHRSLLSVRNLAEAVVTVLEAPGPLRRPLLVADPDPVTVPEMIAALREGLGRRPGLLPVPPGLLGLAARVLKRTDAFDRLNAPLVASPAALSRLGWRPPVPTTKAGLAELARTAPAS
jgi:UDP-glucose 4-epimerase